MSLNYAKWDAIDSSDDEDSTRKQQVVRKQAYALSATEELAAIAEEARRVEEERLRLEAQVAHWTEELDKKDAAGVAHACGKEPDLDARQMPEDAAESVVQSADCGKPSGAAVQDDGAVTDQTTRAEQQQRQQQQQQQQSEQHPPLQLVLDGDSGELVLDSSDAHRSRRRGLDALWAEEKEREFEARPAPDGGRGKAIAAELRKQAEDAAAAEAAREAAAEAAANRPPSPDGKFGVVASSLRRLKKLEPAAAGAIEQECGVSIGKSDVFRLVLEHPTSKLKKQTRVLILTAGDSFLCEEPISEEPLPISEEARALEDSALASLAGQADLPAARDCEQRVNGSRADGTGDSMDECRVPIINEAHALTDDAVIASADQADAPAVKDCLQQDDRRTAEGAAASTAVCWELSSEETRALKDDAAAGSADQADSPAGKDCHQQDEGCKAEGSACDNLSDELIAEKFGTLQDGALKGSVDLSDCRKKDEAGNQPDCEEAFGMEDGALVGSAVQSDLPTAKDGQQPDHGSEAEGIASDSPAAAAAAAAPATAAAASAAFAATAATETSASAPVGQDRAETDGERVATAGLATDVALELSADAASGGDSMMEPQEAQPDVSGCADLNAETSAPRLGHEGTADGIAEPSVLEIECCFFRAKPSRLRLAKKLGKIPVLHLALKTNDGLLQAMEFIGIHQRRYFEEDHTSDAIARNLVESLLKVALEFVLHPSRTRYAKERLVLRECSTSAEVRKNRDVLLLGMVSQLKRINDTIQHVHIEFCDGWSRQQHAARSKKDRSFLILDEDILKIAPMRRELAKAPSARGAFRGLGQGFLNSEKIRRRGLVDELRPHNGGDTSSASSSSTHTEPHQGATTSKSGEASSKHVADADRVIGAESTLIASIKPSERTRINDTPENTAGPPAIETTLEERRRLVLGGVDVTADKVELLPGDVMRSLHSPAVTGDADRAAAPAASDGSATAIVANSISAEGCLSSSAIALDAAEEEEVDELLDEPPPTLSELANRLFGSELEINVDAASDEGAGHLTESTKTPSPKASSRGGGAPSERSEPVTEDSADTFEHTEKPAAGIRWLQQRRKERGNAAASSSDAANTGSNQQAATPSPQSDPSDDLVSLWMKQRW